MTTTARERVSPRRFEVRLPVQREKPCAGKESDADLIADVRAGRMASYGTLYERHNAAARTLASALVRSRTETDDLVSEAFAKVLNTLHAGKGPDTVFRPYLLATLRYTAYAKGREDNRLDLHGDMNEVSAAPITTLLATRVAEFERALALAAFARLPRRWQTVLWHIEIERRKPAEIAPLLDLTANGVSALACRAREGLRQAYLQVHLRESTAERCRGTAARLGAWTRGSLSKRDTERTADHLSRCPRCTDLARELDDLNRTIDR